MSSKGTLYLLPAPLGALDDIAWLPAPLLGTARRLQHFVVENAKSARQLLKAIGTDAPLQQLQMQELNEHTPAEAIVRLLQPLLEGHDVGLLSEAGCPGIADPGAPLVAECHRRNIRVVPCVGPSSIVLALMASGASGQRFAFHGYLPADESSRLQAIRDLEQRSARHNEAQIFIETPYRNNALLGSLLLTLRADSWLAAAANLATAEEQVIARPVQEWPGDIDLNRKPTVFIVQARMSTASRPAAPQRPAATAASDKGRARRR